MFDKKDAKTIARAIEELIDAKLRYAETGLPVHDTVAKECQRDLCLACQQLITDEE